MGEASKADLQPLLFTFRRLLANRADLLLVLAGSPTEPDYPQRLDAVAASLGVGGNLRIIPNVPHYLKPVLYSASDIFVAPADNVQETFGLVILEAMSAGLPVVASEWSGYKELVVHGETGFLARTFWNDSAADVLSLAAPLFDEGLPEAFLARRTIVDMEDTHQHLLDLVENPVLRRRLGDAGRTRVNQVFAWPVVITAYRDLWAEQIQILSGAVSGSKEGTPILSYRDIFGHYATEPLSHSHTVTVTSDGRQFGHSNRPVNPSSLQ